MKKTITLFLLASLTSFGPSLQASTENNKQIIEIEKPKRPTEEISKTQRLMRKTYWSIGDTMTEKNFYIFNTTENEVPKTAWEDLLEAIDSNPDDFLKKFKKKLSKINPNDSKTEMSKKRQYCVFRYVQKKEALFNLAVSAIKPGNKNDPLVLEDEKLAKVYIEEIEKNPKNCLKDNTHLKLVLDLAQAGFNPAKIVFFRHHFNNLRGATKEGNQTLLTDSLKEVLELFENKKIDTKSCEKKFLKIAVEGLKIESMHDISELSDVTDILGLESIPPEVHIQLVVEASTPDEEFPDIPSNYFNLKKTHSFIAGVLARDPISSKRRQSLLEKLYKDKIIHENDRMDKILEKMALYATIECEGYGYVYYSELVNWFADIGKTKEYELEEEKRYENIQSALKNLAKINGDLFENNEDMLQKILSYSYTMEPSDRWKATEDLLEKLEKNGDVDGAQSVRNMITTALQVTQLGAHTWKAEKRKSILMRLLFPKNPSKNVLNYAHDTWADALKGALLMAIKQEKINPSHKALAQLFGIEKSNPKEVWNELFILADQAHNKKAQEAIVHLQEIQGNDEYAMFLKYYYRVQNL